MPDPERIAFYRAIADAPDDDTPRLVFADWLQEHGEDARAEFIRLQCAIAAGIMWPRSTPGRWPAITQTSSGKASAALIQKRRVVSRSSSLGPSSSTLTDGIYSWDFGDGSSGSGMMTTHRFTSARTFTVTLTVRNERGQSATISKTVTVIDD